MQDNQIVSSVLDGNAASFELLVLKYQQQLYLAAYAVTRNHAVSEDIVQDAFLKAYEKLDTLNNPYGFYQWIKKIVINMALNHYYRNKLNTNALNDEELVSSENHLAYRNPEDCTLEDEMKRYIKTFVEALPEKFRLILVMREIEESSYEEIAELLEIPVGTVRSRLYKARQLLRDRLIKQGLADGIYSKHII